MHTLARISQTRRRQGTSRSRPPSASEGAFVSCLMNGVEYQALTDSVPRQQLWVNLFSIASKAQLLLFSPNESMAPSCQQSVPWCHWGSRCDTSEWGSHNPTKCLHFQGPISRELNWHKRLEAHRCVLHFEWHCQYKQWWKQEVLPELE